MTPPSPDHVERRRCLTPDVFDDGDSGVGDGAQGRRVDGRAVSADEGFDHRGGVLEVRVQVQKDHRAPTHTTCIQA